MATIPDAGPIWWDRDCDDEGMPIRADVRQAARELWPEAVKRVKRMLSDAAEAADLMETTVLLISHHLDRVRTPLSAPKIPSLVSLHFSQELTRIAKKLSRIELVGDGTSIEELAVAEGWAERVDRYLDFEKLFISLKNTSRIVVVMRFQAHDWKLIGHKMGALPSTIRRNFWKDVREVLSRMGLGDSSGENGGQK